MMVEGIGNDIFLPTKDRPISSLRQQQTPFFICIILEKHNTLLKPTFFTGQ